MSDYAPSIDRLWEATPLGRARIGNPPTSHEAAADVDEFDADHFRVILQALDLGPAGCTEVARRCRVLDRHQVGRRMSELEKKGRVVVDGKERNSGGKLEQRYRRVS